MKKFTRKSKIIIFILLCPVFLSFSANGPADEEAGFVQEMLNTHYAILPDAPALKKYELQVSGTGFCRYKKYYQSGKQEYFSFHFLKYKAADYVGNSTSGTLYLHTLNDDVIVQTYKERRGGDIDSMATSLAIPVKNMEPEDLELLQEKFRQLQAKLR